MKGKPVNPRTKGSVWQWKIINILTLRFRFQRRFVKNTLKTLTKLTEKPRVSVLKRNMGGGLLLWKFTKFFNKILFKVLREKCPSTEFFLVRIFLHSDWIRNRKNSLFGHFHAVKEHPRMFSSAGYLHEIVFKSSLMFCHCFLLITFCSILKMF